MDRYIFQDSDPIHNARATDDKKNCGAYCLAYYCWLHEKNPPNDWKDVSTWYQQIQFEENSWGFDQKYSSPFKIQNVLQGRLLKKADLYLDEAPVPPENPVLNGLVTRFAVILKPYEHFKVDEAQNLKEQQAAFMICYNPTNLALLHYIMILMQGEGDYLLLDPNTGVPRILDAAPARGARIDGTNWYYSGAGILIR